MLRTTLLIALVIATGCGGANSSNPKSTSGATQLRITVWPQGKPGASATHKLGCPGGTGTLPAAGSACKKLARLGRSAFAPVPRGTACTLIYGGPQVARVSGVFSGKTINAVFSRGDGCQIARWSRVAFLFPHGLASP